MEKIVMWTATTTMSTSVSVFVDVVAPVLAFVVGFLVPLFYWRIVNDVNCCFLLLASFRLLDGLVFGV